MTKMLYRNTLPNGSRCRSVAAVLTFAIVATTIAGCDDDQTTNAVAAEQAKAVRRYDVLQSVAQNGRLMVAVGAYGVVETSSDNGANWVRRELPDAPALIKVAACGDGHFAALDMNGQLWHAGADAATWSVAPIPAQDALLDLTCTSDNRVWAIGARSAIFSSVDDGKTWTNQSRDEDAQLLNIQFTSALNGVIAGEFGHVMVTHDGGKSWADGGALGDTFYPQGMNFADDNRGVVVGLNGVEQETVDGGKTWKVHHVPTQAPLYGVILAKSGKAFVVGAAGTAFSGLGDQWTAMPGLPLTDLRGLSSASGGAVSTVVVSGAGLLTALPPSHTGL